MNKLTHNQTCRHAHTFRKHNAVTECSHTRTHTKQCRSLSARTHTNTPHTHTYRMESVSARTYGHKRTHTSTQSVSARIQTHTTYQWRIQDFSEEGAPTPQGGRQHTILLNFPKNCMKLKEFGPPEGGRRVSLAPPLRSATAYVHTMESLSARTHTNTTHAHIHNRVSECMHAYKHTPHTHTYTMESLSARSSSEDQ